MIELKVQERDIHKKRVAEERRRTEELNRTEELTQHGKGKGKKNTSQKTRNETFFFRFLMAAAIPCDI